jgi:hypothetical protein
VEEVGIEERSVDVLLAGLAGEGGSEMVAVWSATSRRAPLERD